MDPRAILGFGLLAFFAIIITAWFFPALFLALVFILAFFAIVVFAPQFAGTKAGLIVILALLGLAAAFGFAQVGQQASLSLVHAPL